MILRNIINNLLIEPPDTIGNIQNITWNNSTELLTSLGWRQMPDIPPLLEGYSRISCIPIELDGINGQWQIVDKSNSEIEQEQLQIQQQEDDAKFATLPLEDAIAFKYILCSYFGEDATTNHNISSNSVKLYFNQLNPISNNDLKNCMNLMYLHAKLCAWNGTDETWTLYEKWGDRIT